MLRDLTAQAELRDALHKLKAKYFTGRSGAVPFALTSQVLQYADWTPDVLEAQHKTLVDLLVKEWAL